MKPFIATCGYDNKTEYALTPLTLEELKALTGGEHLQTLDRNGKVRNCKVNGKCRTWKRDPTRIEVPCKYGLYEHFTVRAVGELFHARIHKRTDGVIVSG